MNVSSRDTIVHGALPFVARLLICAIFIQGAMGKLTGWSSQAAYMASKNVPFVTPLLGIALVIEAVGVLCLVVDLEERRRTEDVLRRGEERLREVLAIAPDGMVLVDASGLVVLVNARTVLLPYLLLRISLSTVLRALAE